MRSDTERNKHNIHKNVSQKPNHQKTMSLCLGMNGFSHSPDHNLIPLLLPPHQPKRKIRKPHSVKMLNLQEKNVSYNTTTAVSWVTHWHLWHHCHHYCYLSTNTTGREESGQGGVSQGAILDLASTYPQVRHRFPPF